MNYVICGQNSLMIEERSAELVLEFDPTGFGTTTFDVQTSSIEAIATACHSSPFFGGTRVVVLRQPLVQPRRGEVDTGSEDDAPAGRIPWPDLLQVLRAAPASTVIIVRHEGSLSPAHYARKALRELGWHTEQHEIPRGAELLSWVTSRARSVGYTFGPGAAERLLDLLYPLTWTIANPRYETSIPDTRLIASEISKLALSCVDGVVAIESVESLVEDRSGYKAFDLNDAVFRGRTERALVELDLMIDAGEAAERILAQLAGDLVAMSSARWIEKFDCRNVAAAAGMPEGRLKASQRRQFSRLTLQTMADAIRQCDASVKTGKVPDTSSVIAPLVAILAETAKTPDSTR
jgi:DNA polymerase III delta subunit